MCMYSIVYQLYTIVYQCVPLCTIEYNYIPLGIVSHCVPMCPIVYCCVSLCTMVYYCLPSSPSHSTELYQVHQQQNCPGVPRVGKLHAGSPDISCERYNPGGQKYFWGPNSISGGQIIFQGGQIIYLGSQIIFLNLVGQIQSAKIGQNKP